MKKKTGRKGERQKNAGLEYRVRQSQFSLPRSKSECPRTRQDPGKVWTCPTCLKLWEARGTGTKLRPYAGQEMRVNRASGMRAARQTWPGWWPGATAARNLRSAGYDGIEINASPSSIFGLHVPVLQQRETELRRVI